MTFVLAINNSNARPHRGLNGTDDCPLPCCGVVSVADSSFKPVWPHHRFRGQWETPSARDDYHLLLPGRRKKNTVRREECRYVYILDHTATEKRWFHTLPAWIQRRYLSPPPQDSFERVKAYVPASRSRTVGPTQEPHQAISSPTRRPRYMFFTSTQTAGTGRYIKLEPIFP